MVEIPKKEVQGNSEPIEKSVDLESTKTASSSSQKPRKKWKNTIIVSIWPKLQAIAKKKWNVTVGRVA